MSFWDLEKIKKLWQARSSPQKATLEKSKNKNPKTPPKKFDIIRAFDNT